MFLRLLGLMWLLTVSIPSFAANHGGGATRIVVHGVTVINPGTQTVARDMDVEISGQRILSMRPVGAKLPTDALVVDGSGKYLLPGLWDMHVHTQMGDWIPGGREVTLPLFVANGITGVRDMGSDLPTILNWKHEIEAGTLLGPRMVVAGPMLDGPIPRFPASMSIASEADARKSVDDLKRQGVDFIKIQSLIPREAYFAAAQQAKKDHIVFVGHVPDAVRASEAAQAGQKSIEHYTGIFEGCTAIEDQLMKGPKGPRKVVENFDHSRADALIALMAKDHTWQVPTLIWERGQWLIDKSDFSHPALARYVPPYWRDKTWRGFTSDILKDMDTDPISFRERFVEMEMEMTLAMHKAGVRFLAGTDTAAGVYVMPGFSLHDELALFVKAGFTPMEALQTATSNPAEFLGTQALMGSVEAGKLADLVLLDANPLEDIHNTTKIEAVILNGKYLSRADLDRILSGVESASQKIH